MNTVIEILKKHLVDNGFDGLVRDDYECGCGIDDLQPCGDDFSKCMPAFRDPKTDKFAASKEHFIEPLGD